MELKEQLFAYIKKKYAAEPEYLWMRYPNYAVFRHTDNKKWFALVMDIKRSKLGLNGDDAVDILNVKLPDPLLVDLLIKQPGYLRGYHIIRGNWVSILLDGTVPFEDIVKWLEESFLTTASVQKKQKLRPPKEWVVPANPKYYDIEQAFEAADEIDWKQGAGIRDGDTVFVYVAAPVSAILYKCRVTKTNIPFRFSSEHVRIQELMKLKLLRRYSPERFTFEILNMEYGIYAVRGPRGIPQGLSEALNK